MAPPETPLVMTVSPPDAVPMSIPFTFTKSTEKSDAGEIVSPPELARDSCTAVWTVTLGLLRYKFTVSFLWPLLVLKVPKVTSAESDPLKEPAPFELLTKYAEVGGNRAITDTGCEIGTSNGIGRDRSVISRAGAIAGGSADFYNQIRWMSEVRRDIGRQYLQIAVHVANNVVKRRYVKNAAADPSGYHGCAGRQRADTEPVHCFPKPEV